MSFIEVRPGFEKVRAVKNFSVFFEKKELAEFLKLTSYFRRFIENYSTIAKPLTDPTKMEQNVARKWINRRTG